jgi:hypothetical protein
MESTASRCTLGGVVDVIQNTSRRQPVTAETQIGHLLYTVYSVTCALLPYVITDVSVGN